MLGVYDRLYISYVLYLYIYICIYVFHVEYIYIYTHIYVYWAFLNRYHKRCGMAAYSVGPFKSF